MKTVLFGFLAALTAVCGMSQINPAAKGAIADKDKLIGAWRLASISGPDGKPLTTGVPLDMLIYTCDGHVSVQLMYPKSASALTNEYVKNGYEASFGGFDVNEATHTVTHHVQASNTGDFLVGKDLQRLYRFSGDRRLIIRSARPDEYWSVTWERY